jgi:hypothetical protein
MMVTIVEQNHPARLRVFLKEVAGAFLCFEVLDSKQSSAVLPSFHFELTVS